MSYNKKKLSAYVVFYNINSPCGVIRGVGGGGRGGGGEEREKKERQRRDREKACQTIFGPIHVGKSLGLQSLSVLSSMNVSAKIPNGFYDGYIYQNGNKCVF